MGLTNFIATPRFTSFHEVDTSRAAMTLVFFDLAICEIKIATLNARYSAQLTETTEQATILV